MDLELGKFLKTIDIDNIIITITCDHRTCSLKDYKEYRHLTDPVPFLVFGRGIKPNSLKFDEKTCEKGIRLNNLIENMVRNRS